MERRVRLLCLAAWMVGWTGVVAPRSVLAQSASDKATARQLATEGIRLFRQEKFPDALDKLERAQALFDAPVHLVYIARCLVKAGRLVDAAETYRKLIRTELSPQAPQTFKDAVSDGEKELAELEPKVPTLRVDVIPANQRDLRLSIDGETVSTAVLGINRPINPGSHVIEVSAKGWSPMSRRVEVGVGAKQAVSLELAASGEGSDGADGVAKSQVDANTSTSSGEVGGSNGSGAAQATRPAQTRIIAGIDFGGVIPIAGKIDNQSHVTGPADDRSIDGRYGLGGGLELRLGVALPVAEVAAVTPFVFVSGNAYLPGRLYKTSADSGFGLPGYDSVMTANPKSVALGLAVRVDTLPRRPFQLGGFGELGVLGQTYTTKGTWTVTNPAGACDFTEEFSGLGGRLRAGMLMPVSGLVSLVGAAGVSLIRINSAGFSERTCSTNQLQFTGPEKASVPSGDAAIHTVIGVSLGAELGFAP